MFEFSVMFLCNVSLKLCVRFSVLCSDISVMLVVLCCGLSGSLVIMLWIVVMCIIGLLM